MTVASEPEKRLDTPPSPMAHQLARLMMLERAAGYLGGQDALAQAIGIQPRSLRAKLSADRGVSNDDLALVALALVARSMEIHVAATKMQELVT